MSSQPPPTASFLTTVPTLRSHRCYNCNNRFFITPVSTITEATSSSSSWPPTSFCCPHCFQCHLIPNYTVVPPTPPTPPPVVHALPALSTFTHNNSQDDDDEEDYDSEEDEDEEEEDEEEEEDDGEEIGYEYEEFSYAFLNSNNNISPASINSFSNSLPVQELNPNNKSMCSICMEEFGRKTVVELPCNHCFDRDCIGEWIKRKTTCPMCRFKLPLGDGNKVEMRRGVNEYNGLINRIVREAREPPVLRRVNAEVSLSAIAGAEARGVDRRVLSTNRGGEATRDEDGDTMMEDAA